MAEFVLVPGAWLGSWAWDDVVPQLWAAGHGTHPLTLSGVGERQGVTADQQTHVQDIVDEITNRASTMSFWSGTAIQVFRPGKPLSGSATG